MNKLIYLCFFLAHVVAFDAPENCQWKFLDNIDRKISLSCNLRTLNSDFQKNQLSFIQSGYAVELHMRCSDVLFFQSTLNPRIFQNLKSLEVLKIDFCKLTTLPGGTFLELDNMRTLTINTHNGDWSAMALELNGESFVGMSNLEKLDIGRNNIWSLPERVFCSLPALRELNLTWNRLQDISEIGTAGGCGAHLLNLDLSGNDLVIIPDDGLAGLKSLKEIYLQYNEISMLGDRAFTGLYELKTLNISSNKLVALPPAVFNETTSLTKLYLQNNSISVFAPHLFSPLSQLSVLDLSDNQLTSEFIMSNTFTGLVRLIVLSLSKNKLTNLHKDMFNDLSALQILDVSYNNLRYISDNTFSSLANLHRLDLSFNQLQTLGGQSLSGLHVLASLYLTNNNLTHIEDKTFENCSNLREIRLDYNFLTAIPDAVVNMKSIRTLQLSHNLFSDISAKDFIYMNNLRNLDLSNNFIKSIPKESFLGLSEMEVLDLSRNELESLSNGLFDTNSDLELLRLDGNKLTDINGLFASLPKLMWLNVSDNAITWFDYALIPEKLLYLNLGNNDIKELGNYFNIEGKLKLGTLDISYNEIQVLGPMSIPNSIVMLYLQNNLISELKPGTFTEKQNLSKVNLSDNLLSHIELNSLSLAPYEEDQKLPEFYIGGNPILCDCNMEWMHRAAQISARRQHPRVMDLDKVICTLPYPRSDVNRIPFLESDASQFLCPYTSHCFALCQCCDFIACDCQMTCPSGCSCYHDDTWATNIVDCSARGNSQLPDDVPMDATIVYMDGNNMPMLDAHRLIGRKNLRSLFLNNSQIESIENRTFHGLSSLKVLHLEDNKLFQLHGYEFEHLEHLRELYLQNNFIRSINNATFIGLKAIVVIHLNGNAVHNFPVWQFRLNKGLREVTLGMNPFSCECQFVTNLKKWLISNKNIVTDSRNVYCSGNYSNSMPSYILTDSYSCENFIPYTAKEPAKAPNEYLKPVLITMGVCFIVLFFGVAIVKCRSRISKNVKKCGLQWSADSCAGKSDSYVYDAFISYSDFDGAFVNDMANQLENVEPCYKLCLCVRDYESTGNYVGDFLVTSVEVSRSVILVVSDNFIRDWNKCSFKATHLTALKGISNKIIVLFISDIHESSLDPDLVSLIKNSTKLKYTDKTFWNKLRSSLAKEGKMINQPCFISDTNYMIRNKTFPAQKSGQLITNMMLNGKNPIQRYHPSPGTLHNHNLQQLGPTALLHHPHHHQVRSSISDNGDLLDRTFTSSDTTQSSLTPSLSHSYMSLDYISSRSSHIYASIDDPPPPISTLCPPALPPSSQPVSTHQCSSGPLFQNSLVRPACLQVPHSGQNVITPSYFI